MNPTPMTAQRCFVTGTDTGVGKTVVSAALLHLLAQSGLRCAGFKPVAAGMSLICGETHEKTPGRSQVFSPPSGGLAQSDRFGGAHEKTPGRSQVFSPPSGGLAQSDRFGGAHEKTPGRSQVFSSPLGGLAQSDRFGGVVNDDVETLRRASSIELTADEVGPYQFEAACAPHIAAQLEGRSIDRLLIQKAADDLSQKADYLVMEGVGGFCVPLSAPGENPSWNTADLAWDVTEGGQWPVVMVVGLRLGCINHALLSAQAIRARGLRLAAWVGNTIDGDMPHQQDVVRCLQESLSTQYQAELLGIVPRLVQINAQTVAAHLSQDAIAKLSAHEKTPGRSQVFSYPSGGLAHGDRSGGALKQVFDHHDGDEASKPCGRMRP